MTTYSVKSAQRVLELLEFFAEWRRPASIKEISQSLGYPQSSTSVLLKSLAELGYFDQDMRTRMYVPSVRLALVSAWIQEEMFSEQSLLRLMQTVQSKTGHTVMIGAQEGIQVRYLHVLQATRVGSFTAKIGSLRSLFRSAAGKMLLTTKTEREIAQLLQKANAFEPDSFKRIQFQVVQRETEKARRDGYALSMGTSVPGAAALAVLLPVKRGIEPMTLSVGGPMAEVKAEDKRLVDILRESIEPIRRAVIT